ncbi:ester cyclase [Microbispora sp. NPDC049125]|uniref:ester cyclase n=1 Tax=Microbispora sp. NPDC049125 TaxID=3154929 RepID=UPI0034661889
MFGSRQRADELLDALNRHDLDRALRYYSDDAVLVSPMGVAEGPQGIAGYYESYFKGFPDFCMTVWQRVLTGDPVFTEWTATGTHTGPFPLPDGGVLHETGRRITVRGCGTCAVRGGKIIVHREYYDQLELYSQLGFSMMPDADF